MASPRHDHVDRIFITGGTGFVGSAIRTALGSRPLRMLVRNLDKHADHDSQLVELVEGDVADAGSLRDAMIGCSTVIHLVAIIEEQGDRTFDRIIRQGTENVVNEAKAAGVGRILHMSALGAANLPEFPYHQSKWRAEQAVQASGLSWTIFRPSIIFGPGDGFINTLAGVVRSFPLMPVPGDGQSRFQPVFVGDVASSFVHALDDPSTEGQTFDLGGPDVFTYEELLTMIAAELGKSRRTVHIPLSLVRAAVRLSQPLPKRLRPPVTREQLKMLALDNTTTNSSTEQLIGRAPAGLPGHLDYIR